MVCGPIVELTPPEQPTGKGAGKGKGRRKRDAVDEADRDDDTGLLGDAGADADTEGRALAQLRKQRR